MYLLRLACMNRKWLFFSTPDKRSYNTAGGYADIDRDGNLILNWDDYILDLNTLKLYQVVDFGRDKKFKPSEFINVFEGTPDMAFISSILQRDYIFEYKNGEALYLRHDDGVFYLTSGVLYRLKIRQRYGSITEPASILDVPHIANTQRILDDVRLLRADDDCLCTPQYKKVSEMSITQLKRNILFGGK